LKGGIVLDIPLGVPTFLNLTLRVGSMLLVDHIRDQRNLKRHEQALLDRAVEEEERLQWSRFEKQAEEEVNMFMNYWADAMDLNTFRLSLVEGEDFITNVCGEQHSIATTGWFWEPNPN
jgi:hypothetical protein